MHRARQSGTLQGTSTIILIALACAALLAIALVARPATARTPLVRVRPGAAATTREGMGGVIVDVQEELVLLAVAGPEPGIVAGLWVRRDRLFELAPHELDPAIASETIEGLRGRLTRLEQPGTAVSAPTGRLHRLGAAAFDHRRRFLQVGLVIALVSAPIAGTAHSVLSSGGFVPDGEAMRVERDLRERFHYPATTLFVYVDGSPAAVQAQVAASRKQLRAIEGVESVQDVVPSPDGTAVLIPIGLDTTKDEVTRNAISEVRSVTEEAGMRDVRMAGRAVFSKDVEQQMRVDMSKAEMIGIPLALVILLIVFGTVPAALLPIGVGILSVLLTMAVVHLVGLAADVSVFVLNVVTLLGFGLGIDYTIIMVSRFRAELARGRSVRAATIVTTTQAGRAILISGLAVLLGLSGMMLVPLGVMHSIAIGGVIVVGMTMLVSIVLVPPTLALVGGGLERFAVRKPRTDGTAGDGWRRLTHAVMRRPGMVVCLVLAGLVPLALMAHGAKLEVPLQEALPRHVESRATQRVIERDFDQRVASPINVVAHTDDAGELQALGDRLLKVPNVFSVGQQRSSDGRTLFIVTAAKDRSGGSAARDTVTSIRGLEARAGSPALDIGGQFAWEQEFFQILQARMPLVLLFVFGSAFLVLLVAFRSIVIPLKAIVLNGVSIAATLGIVVLVFQHGFGVGLLGSHQLGWIDASLPLVLFCLLFGLSMDYEVFMLASIAEGWQDGLDTTNATAEGIARTAPLVTGAAMILVALGVAFTTTELILVKEIGFGVAVALLLDATIVRGLLVPGVMRLLGDRNWWLPTWLARRLPVARWA
ncbi:MAG: hypothetical protein JWN72_1944 [Thermoleophilia bacterium]|nr:hypothetical protein [Thermoleophilia bacterium]